MSVSIAARALGCLALCAGCVQLTWERQSRNSPLPEDELVELAAGADLADCLAAFGAPLWVWEHVDDGRDSAALAYGWYDERALGLRVSVPVSDSYSASLDYDRIGSKMRGLVLFFDSEWKLVTWRTGLLRDLTVELDRRPADVEYAEEDPGGP
jgi:hypothetical protein